MANRCDSDLDVVGIQHGESVATTLRLVALCISTSIVFPWLDARHRAHLRLLFLHWVSGVIYVLVQFIMSAMVLNCWSSTRSAPFIYCLKFAELVALNLWSFSSVAIALLIASIVNAFKGCRRVPPVTGSPAVIGYCFVLSLAIACGSAAFWNGVLVTGGYYWIYSKNNVSRSRHSNRREIDSRRRKSARINGKEKEEYSVGQIVAGFVMLAAMVFITTPPRIDSLKTCFKTSKRIKYYFILTLWGTLVYLYNGTVTLVDEFTDSGLRRDLVIFDWCSKYVHVIADTMILIGALKAQQRRWGEFPSLAESESGLGNTRSAPGGVSRRSIPVTSNETTIDTVMAGATYAGAGAPSLSSPEMLCSSEYNTPLPVPVPKTKGGVAIGVHCNGSCSNSECTAEGAVEDGRRERSRNVPRKLKPLTVPV